MEVAVHIQTSSSQYGLREIKHHLQSLYNSFSSIHGDLIEELPGSLSRIYVGDEFCLNRLPVLSVLKDIYQFAEKKKFNVTFLTPVLTNEGIEKFIKLFDFINEVDPYSEIVINDWGVLAFLKRKYPSFQLSLGRLLNKGFKDPRLPEPEKTINTSKEASQLLNESTFDLVEYQKKIAELGVIRLERDLMPYANQLSESNCMLRTSIYFPFGYITTSRVCWIASFDQQAGKKFIPGGKCVRRCNEFIFILKNKVCSLNIVQNGNTIFYLYTLSMLNNLIHIAKGTDLRLIYQGFYLGQQQ
jgi:hypothetical protein